VTTAAAVIITGIIVADNISGGMISQGIADFIGSLISPSAPVRDKEGNPIPPAQQTPSPTGKGANAGPENIGDPGDLGGSNFKGPNDATGATIVVIGAAVVTSVYDNVTGVSSSPPPDTSKNVSHDKSSTNKGK
jgi:hypothetical protein